MASGPSLTRTDARRWRLASTAATASITRYSRRWLPIYGDDVIGRYHNAPYGSLPPHCFQEAEDASRPLQKTRRNQAVVICGESGAGKTETTKLMLHYLAVASTRQGTVPTGPTRRQAQGRVEPSV